MCGKKRTAVFIGRQSFQQMGPQAVKELFKTHDNFVKSLTKIPMPLMTNIDRICREMAPDGTVIERSMRQWAENLYDKKGLSMQCDVENGGRDRNAYMLAPKKFEEKVKAELKAYKARVRPFKQREEQFHASLQQPGRPNSIYVPTQSAISNIAFLQSFISSADHWCSRSCQTVRYQDAESKSASSPVHSHSRRANSDYRDCRQYDRGHYRIVTLWNYHEAIGL